MTKAERVQRQKRAERNAGQKERWTTDPDFRQKYLARFAARRANPWQGQACEAAYLGGCGAGVPERHHPFGYTGETDGTPNALIVEWYCHRHHIQLEKGCLGVAPALALAA